MGIFDERYNFRFANEGDISNLMTFIKAYWSENHIFAVDEDFFRYEFQQGNDVHFIMAENRQTGKLDGIYGFYLYESTGTIHDFSGAIWKISPYCKTPMLGTEIYKRLVSMLNARASLGNGANPATAIPLEHDLLNHFTGKLKHFYRLSDRKEYKVAGITNKIIPNIDNHISEELKQYDSFEKFLFRFKDVLGRERIPYKDNWYIEKRYFKHPIYEYKVYGIGETCAIVGREICIKKTKIFRIVDVLGEPEKLSYAGYGIQNLIDKNDYEYVDIYEYGVRDKVFSDMGFIERKENDVNIIPNYFEPFERRNVEIYYDISRSDVFLFKGDGDQDRPNHR